MSFYDKTFVLFCLCWDKPEHGDGGEDEGERTAKEKKHEKPDPENSKSRLSYAGSWM
jgi:hypothetical protein